MTIDNLRRVLINAGEQSVATDYMALQRQMHMLIHSLMVPGLLGYVDSSMGHAHPEQRIIGFSAGTHPTDIGFCPFPAYGYVAPNGVANQLVVTPGPLVQLAATSDVDPEVEASENVLIFWNPSAEILETAVGDATNARVDVVQVKLEYEDGAPEARVFSTDPVKSTKDLNALTANCETVLRAKQAGAGGNSISIAFVADGLGVGSLDQSGNALTFHYESGVTTVADFETAVAASTLIEIQTVDGTGGTLTDPGDTFAASLFTGGVDRVIASNPSLNKARRVKATFSIKQGTPTAAPAYPAPDAGYCAIGAVYVPALHNASHSLNNIRDVRMPLGGLRIYDVPFNQINHAGGGTTWTQDFDEWKIVAPASGTGYAYAACPAGGENGRLVGVQIYGQPPTVDGSLQAHVVRAEIDGSAGPTITQMASLIGLFNELDSHPGIPGHAYEGITDFADTSNSIGAAIGSRSGRVGNAIWTNGRTCGPVKTYTGAAIAFPTGSASYNLDTLAVQVLAQKDSAFASPFLSLVRFYVAHGMG
jgi:hypothetical protein